MALTLDKFEKICFDSTFKVDAHEYKNPNIHRAVFKLYGNGEIFSTKEFEKFRDEIGHNIKISSFKGFGFSLILNGYAIPDEIPAQWVDNTDRRGGACQWVVITDKDMKKGVGIHMWQRGKTTDIYESIISQLTMEGVSFVDHVKEPAGLMKLAIKFNPLLRMQLYKSQIDKDKPKTIFGQK